MYVMARCRRRVGKDQRQECTVKQVCMPFASIRKIVPVPTQLKLKAMPNAANLEIDNKGPSDGGLLPSIFRTIVEPSAWQEP